MIRFPMLWIDQCRLLATPLLTAALTFPAMAASPTLPLAEFDASRTVECRDVTPPEFAKANPQEKVIEARFRVSILLTQGRQEDIEDLVVVIQSPENRLHVVDFSPKTELASDVSGPIETTQTNDHTNTAEAKLGAGVVARYGIADVGVSTSNHQTTKSSFKQLPAKCLVLASGTAHGEHGVFFKVKGSPQVSLEGAKEFTCLFAVPKSWRGDWCTLSCQARAYKKHYLNSKMENCGQSEVFIGMYLAGDDASKAAARRLDAVQGQNRGVDETIALASAAATRARPAPSFDLAVVFKPLTWFDASAADKNRPRPPAGMADSLHRLGRFGSSEMSPR